MLRGDFVCALRRQPNRPWPVASRRRREEPVSPVGRNGLAAAEKRRGVRRIALREQLYPTGAPERAMPAEFTVSA